MVYAMFDETVSYERPGNGFANTKRYMAFSSSNKLNSFLEERKIFDFTACRVSRKEALKNLEPYRDSRDKGLLLDDPTGDTWVILKFS